jgi:SAM-dependent methyltransferase
MQQFPGDLAGHADRLRWNARYQGGAGTSSEPHPLAVRALALPLPGGPVADLACGVGGSVLFAAAAGRRVTAVDISDVALGLLADEARRRGLAGLITLVQADLLTWRPEPGGYALVLCTGYWDRAVFAAAAQAVAGSGLLAWEALTAKARTVRPGLCAEWCLEAGQPGTLLPSGFTVLDSRDLPGGPHLPRRNLLARRDAAARDAGNARTVTIARPPAGDTGRMIADTERDQAIYQALKAADEVAAAVQAHLIEEHGADPDRDAAQGPATDSLRLLRQARERLGNGLRAVEASTIGESDPISMRKP